MARPKKPRKPSKVEEAYNKELSRIRRFVSRNRKKGWDWEAPIPPRPKRITQASVNRLRNITPETLYKKATKAPEAKENRQRSSRYYSQPKKKRGEQAKVKHVRYRDPIKAEWQQNKNRLKKAIKRAQSRGWIIDENALPENLAVYTAEDLAHIKSIRPLDIYLDSYFVDPETGEAAFGEEGLELEKKVRQRKRIAKKDISVDIKHKLPNEEDVIIAQIESVFNQYFNSGPPFTGNSKGMQWLNEQSRTRTSTALNALQSAIDLRGKKAVAESIKAHGQEVDYLLNSLMYASNQTEAQQSLTQWTIILLERAMSLDELIELEEADYY